MIASVKYPKAGIKMIVKRIAIVRAVIVWYESSSQMKFVVYRITVCATYVVIINQFLILLSSNKKDIKIVLNIVNMTEKTVESMLSP